MNTIVTKAKIQKNQNVDISTNYSFKGIINKKIEANGFNSKLFLGLGLTFNSVDLNFINGKFFFSLDI